MATDTSLSPPFLIGANLPWIHYGIDFGANAWRPDGGVAQPDERAQLRADVRAARRIRRAVRALVSLLRRPCRNSIQRPRTALRARSISCSATSTRRSRSAETARHPRHVRAARLSLVRRRAEPCEACRWADERTCSLTTQTHRQALLDAVLRPVLERYGDEPVDLRVGHHQRARVDQDA